MILFQEEQAAGFDPMFVEVHQPWYVNLFAFYLFAILILLLVRAGQISLALRKLRKLEKMGGGGADRWLLIWDIAKLRARGLEKLAFLTFFLAGFELIVRVHETLGNLVSMTTPMPRWPLISIWQEIPTTSAAVFVCTLLYAFGFFFESRLERRRIAVTAASVPPPTG